MSADRWGPLVEGVARSPTLRRLWQEAFAEEYPEGVDASGFVTLTELVWATEAVGVAPGATLADLGCGAGGPGLFVAGAVGAALVGVDSSPTAVALANSRAAPDALFVEGDLAATGLAGSSFDGAVCFDALHFVTDRAAVLSEAARILRPGARLVATTYDQAATLDVTIPAVDLHHVGDHRPLLAAAGLDVLAYGEPKGWEERQRRFYRSVQAHAAVLKEEMGVGADPLLEEAMTAPHRLHARRRVIFLARKAS